MASSAPIFYDLCCSSSQFRCVLFCLFAFSHGTQQLGFVLLPTILLLFWWVMVPGCRYVAPCWTNSATQHAGIIYEAESDEDEGVCRCWLTRTRRINVNVAHDLWQLYTCTDLLILGSQWTRIDIRPMLHRRDEGNKPKVDRGNMGIVLFSPSVHKEKKKGRRNTLVSQSKSCWCSERQAFLTISIGL